LRYLYSPELEIVNVLQIVAHNDRSKINKVLEFLDKWEKANYIEDQINKIDTRLHANKKEAIMGKSKDQLLRYIYQTITTIREWYDLTERNSQDSKTWNWRRDNANKFRKSFIDLSSEIHNEIADLQSVSNPIEIVAAANCLSKSISVIEAYLGINTIDIIESQPNSIWWVDNNDNLENAITKRLYWFPEIFYDKDDLLSEKDNKRLVEMLLSNSVIDRSLNSIIKIWIDKQDYRFVDILLKGLSDSDSYEEMHKYYKSMLEGSKSTLQAKIKDTQASIEKSIINGIISDEERDDISADISLILPEETLNFMEVFIRLDEIQELLEDELDKRLESLIERWNDDIKPNLNNMGKIDEKEKQKIELFFENMVKDKNTRVIEEWLSSLSELIERGEDYSSSEYDPKYRKTIYIKYLEVREQIEDYINSVDNKLGRLLSAIERGKTWKTIKYGSLPKTQLKQAREVMDNWVQLIDKKHRLEDSDFNKKLMSIFTFIGFTLDKKSYSIKKIKIETNWRLYQIKMSASDLARPFPQLGSLTNGVYDVVCLWEKPGADAIGGLLHDSHLEARNLILIYFGRMTDYQRKELNAMTRKRKMVVAVLDEILLVYLTSRRDEKIKTFLHCSLPLSAINPYMPNIQGDVPSEIFYGRDEIVQDLMRTDGGCLVYGGRQMGKSALLRYVMRRFHNPTMNTYAWVEDIKAIGDSLAGEEASQIWIKIRDIFVNMGLIKPTRLTSRDKIIQKISQYMDENKNSRILIMLDEADNFLNQDSSNSFREVDELRKLMLNTERRFKVVFAGLHHVQRFQNLPNQPLAHFGYPNLVGPLNSNDATKLVREPIEALGYRLDEACVYLILSYTNYHPGLIQIFCHELVKRLHKLPPKNDFTISIEDIEAVYLNEEVRARIKERFEWTLVLDERYQVVAYSMIIEQILTKDSYAQTYNAGTLHELAKGWWDDAFSDMTIDNFRNLLNEMRGLGILVPTADNKYRLRSPNLVRLMGTEKDIEDKLLEFSNKQYNIFKTEEDYNSFHEIIDREKMIFSPLTISQVRNIRNNEFEVGVITASEALGLLRLEETFSKVLAKSEIDNHNNGLVIIPKSIHNSNDMYDWLRESIRKKDNLPGLIVTACQFVDSYTKGLDDNIQSAQKFISDNKKKLSKKGLRVYFIVNPETYWNWMLSDSNIGNELEANGSFTALSRWNETGVTHMLERIEKLYNKDVSKKVLTASGGWPVLLEKIIQKVGDETDPRGVANDLYNDLTKNNNLQNDFIKGTGVMVSTEVIEVCKYIMTNPEITEEYVAPELIECDLRLTDRLCSLAVKFLIQFGIIDKKGEVLEVEPLIKSINLFGAKY